MARRTARREQSAPGSLSHVVTSPSSIHTCCPAQDGPARTQDLLLYCPSRLRNQAGVREDAIGVDGCCDAILPAKPFPNSRRVRIRDP